MRQTAKPDQGAACCDNWQTVLSFSTDPLPPMGRRYDCCIARIQSLTGRPQKNDPYRFAVAAAAIAGRGCPD